jgi:large subunit ribosomal protein L19
MDIKSLVEPKVNRAIPELSPGDTVRVSLKIKEGDKERLQQLQGLVIGVRKGVDGGSFTVRRVSYNVGVERVFPFQSPLIQKVEVLRHGKVRRAKLYYLRKLSVKQSRLKERQSKVRISKQAAPAQEEEAVMPATSSQEQQE